MNPFAGLDAYELRHLVGHLLAADQHDAVHRLMAMSTDEGRHAWFAAKEQIRDVPGFLEDLAGAAERTAAAPDGELLDVRYALVRTSISSVAQSIPPRLIDLALEYDIWTRDRALATAALIPDAGRRFRTFFLLGQRLAGRESRQALWAAFDAAKRMPQDYERIDALRELLELGADAQRGATVRQLLEEAAAASNPDARAREVLESVVPHLADEDQLPALRFVASLADSGMAEAMRILSPRLSPEMRQFALRQAYRSGEVMRWAWIHGLLPELTPAQLAEVLDAAASVFAEADDMPWIDASLMLRELVSRLPLELKRRAVELTARVSAAARPAWLPAIISGLDDDLLARARELVLQLDGEQAIGLYFPEEPLRDRSVGRSASRDDDARGEPEPVADVMSASEWDAALAGIREKKSWDQPKALRALLERTDGPLPAAVADLLDGLHAQYGWIDLLAAAAPRLPGERVAALLAHLPGVIGDDPEAFGLDKGLDGVATYLTAADARAAIAAAAGVRDGKLRNAVLIELLPSLPPDQVAARASGLLDRVGEEPDALERLFPLLPDSSKHSALERLRSARDFDERLARLSGQPESIPDSLLPMFVDFAFALDNRIRRWRILAPFVAVEIPGLRQRIHDELVAAGAKLPKQVGKRAAEKLHAALDAAGAERYRRVLRGGGAAELADELAGTDCSDPTSLPEDLGDMREGDWANYFPQSTPDQRLALLERIAAEPIRQRGLLLADIADWLDPGEALRALELAEAEQDLSNRVWATAELLPRVPEARRAGAARRVIDMACAVEDNGEFILMLDELLSTAEHAWPDDQQRLFTHLRKVGDPGTWLQMAERAPEDVALEAVSAAVAALLAGKAPSATDVSMLADVLPLLARAGLLREALGLLVDHGTSMRSFASYGPVPDSLGAASKISRRIADGAAALSAADRRSAWEIMMAILSDGSRARLLEHLPGLTSLLERLGVSAAGEGLAGEIERAGTWWP